MVKHNNIVPNQHFHKQWQNRIHVNFNQPARKKARRLARAAKAAAVAPRPAAGLLRPAVTCQTVRYNTKRRAGRGFTLDELKAAGVSPKVARSIGIAVDHRRRASSLATFEENVQRLKDYKARLVVFPAHRSKKTKAGDSTAEERKTAAQLEGALFPVEAKTAAVEIADVAAARDGTGAYRRLRQERTNARMIGKRAKRAAEEAAAAEKKKKK